MAAKKSEQQTVICPVGRFFIDLESVFGKQSAFFKEVAQDVDGSRVPSWLKLDEKNLSGEVVSEPTRDHIDVTLNEQLIVEFYSR